MNKQTVAFILIALACAILGYWAATGANVITETERQVEVVDELFGTTTTEWVDDYQPGLDIFGPVALVLFIAALFLFWKGRNEKRRTPELQNS